MDFSYSLPTGLGPCKITSELFKNRKDLGDPDVDILVLNKEKEIVKTFVAHKNVIREKSSVIRALIDKKLSELDLEPDLTPRIVLRVRTTSYPLEVIEQMLIHMYDEAQPKNLNQKDFSLSLLEFAVEFNITELIVLCQNMLGDRIPTLEWDHLLRLLEMGKCDDGRNKLEILLDKVKEYYGKNEDSLQRSPNFVAAMKKYSKICVEIFLY